MNDPLPLSHIRHSRRGHDFKSVYRHRRRNHVVLRGTPLHTAAEAPHEAHSPAQPLRSRHGSRHQRPMPVEAKPQTSNPKLEQKAPLAARRRKQRVEIDTDARKRAKKAQRVQDGARQQSPQRRAARFDRAAPPDRRALNCLPHVCAGRTGRQQRVVESVRVEWQCEDVRGAHHRRCRDGLWPVDIVRATPHRPCRFAAPICADLLGAPRAGTCHARALHAIQFGLSRGHSDGVRPCPRQGGGGIPSSTEPREVHARGALVGIARGRNEFP